MESLQITQNHAKSQQNYITHQIKLREVRARNRTKSHEITKYKQIIPNHNISRYHSKYHEFATKLHKITQKYTKSLQNETKIHAKSSNPFKTQDPTYTNKIKQNHA